MTIFCAEVTIFCAETATCCAELFCCNEPAVFCAEPEPTACCVESILSVLILISQFEGHGAGSGCMNDSCFLPHVLFDILLSEHQMVQKAAGVSEITEFA